MEGRYYGRLPQAAEEEHPAMADSYIFTPRTVVRVLQPHAGESRAEFRRRMQAMITGLVAQAPDRLTVEIDEHEGQPSCIVSARGGAPR
jgi:broad specificity phosphatase PhoE